MTTLRKVYKSYTRRWRIWETNCGRDAGWFVELRGEAIALLTDPLPIDMFWFSYELTPTTTDPGLKSALFTKIFWANAESMGLTFRSREFGDVVNGFPSLDPLLERRRIAMRGLYLSIGEPNPCDRALLWLRKWFRVGRI